VAKAALRHRKEDHTRQRILAVAAQCFADGGYAATSIRDIAHQVGVTVGAIHVHFPSKDQLLVAVYEMGVRRSGDAVDAALSEPTDSWDRLEAAARAHLEALGSNCGFARVIVRVTPSDVGDVAADLTRLREDYEARFRAVIGALRLTPGADRTLLRLMLLGALNHSQTWFKRGTGSARRGRPRARSSWREPSTRRSCDTLAEVAWRSGCAHRCGAPVHRRL
jgi:TetR/AcrR family transcriptional regulator, cholesterol catabolism regulator